MNQDFNSDRFFVCPREIFDLPISRTAKMVYAALCGERSDDGLIIPQYHKLAKLAKVHRKTAKNAVRQLQEVGAVLRMPRYSETGAQLSNRYYVRAFGEDARKDKDFIALVARLNAFMSESA
jgi:hypothetical protein